MNALPGRRARTGLAASVVACWVLVAGGAGLDNEPVQHVALALVTSWSALVTLFAGLRPGPLRRVWLLLGLGLLAYAAGFVVQFWVTAGEHRGPGGINLSDCASLLLYPLADAGLIVLSRSRAGHRDTGSTLEGVVVFTGVSAVVVAATSVAFPSLVNGSVLHVVYALAYPVGGFTLLVVTLTGLSLSGGRVDRVWLLLLVGFALMTVGDALYGFASVHGRFHYGTAIDVLYTGGPVCVALAATGSASARPTARGHRRASATLPSAATLVALAVLVGASYAPVPQLAVWSASLCIVFAVLRTSQLFAQGRALERSRLQARTDELTGLANRRALLEALEASARRLSPTAERPLELLLLDLDGFKIVNDSLGHSAGDELLVLLAGELRAAAPGCLVARLGGDEFAVLLPRGGGTARSGGGTARSGGGAAVLAAALREVVGRPALVQTTRVVVGVSIGHACLVGPLPQVADEILRRADVALYRAKRNHSPCVTWEPSLDQGLRDQLKLLSELRTALLADDQLQAWYQPKADPRDGRVLGYEALVRWQHPTRGLLLPGDFLPAVERAGLLPELTMCVLEQAVALLAELAAAGRQVHVAVNLGAPDLLDADFTRTIRGLLERHGVAAGHLRLEVTETVVMSDPDRIIDTLSGLRALGVGLSLDDYGTGLSSLGYLRVLPVDELKIDRSFVRDLLTDASCALIVASTIGLAHDLRLRVVAEGVEDQPTLEALALAGCDSVQGWHTGRPAPASVVRRTSGVPPRPLPQPRAEVLRGPASLQPAVPACS